MHTASAVAQKKAAAIERVIKKPVSSLLDFAVQARRQRTPGSPVE
jgi:hypothetical protein